MPRREITVFVTSNYSADSYRLALPLSLARVLLVAAAVLALVVFLGFGLVVTGTLRLSRLAYLEYRNRQLEREFRQVALLRDRLTALERESDKMARMLGVELTPPPVNWDSVPGDSSRLPDWVLKEAWGSHPVPVLSPVATGVVSRGFESGHEAIDLATATGTPVRAAADGVVAKAGSDRQFGNSLLLRHAAGYETFYGHLSRKLVKAGDTVLAGQTIGRAGSSGASSAPHLHFEVRKAGRAIDPRTLIRFD
uniref:M23 family metallopeptidase n=1 Tax=candidate division WOR-3 bacterium TaxID=2052148 RepID=A0A7C4GCH2_UNCW3